VGEAVIFLDFDGVICSPRAYVAQTGMDRPLRWADPISGAFVRRLVELTGAKIVVSSTWRHIPADARQVLGQFGLLAHLHEDWKTNESPEGSRPWEIDDWLSRNGHPAFIILDDDMFAWTGPQRARWVHTDIHNGMMLADFEKAMELLKAKKGGLIQ
jgi:hypothetical protein